MTAPGGGPELARATVVIDGDSDGVKDALTDAERAMRASSDRLSLVGEQLHRKLVLPLLAFGVGSAYVFSQFDKGVKRIEATTDTTRAQLDGWRDDIRDLGIEYAVGANVVVEALTAIRRAGTDADDTLTLLRATVAASAAGFGDVQVLGTVGAVALQNYARQGLTATTAMDVFAAALRNSRADANELGGALNTLGPAAAAIGIPFASVAGTLAVLSRSGADVSQTAMGLRALLQALLSPTDQFRDALAAAGLTTAELRRIAGGPGGLIAVLRTLTEALGGNLEALGDVVPNAAVFRTVLSLMAQEGTDVNKILKDVASSAGTLDRATAAGAGPAEELTKALRDLHDVLLSVGPTITSSAAAPIRGFTTILKELGREFEQLPTGVQQAGVAIGTSVVALITALQSYHGVLELLIKLHEVKFFPMLLKQAALMGAGGVIVLGLGLIAVKYLEMKAAVDATNTSIRETNKAMDDVFGRMGADQAARGVARFDERLADFRRQAAEQRRLLNEAGLFLDRQFGTKMDGTRSNVMSDEFTRAGGFNSPANVARLRQMQAQEEEARSRLVEINALIAVMQGRRDIMQSIVDSAADAAASAPTTVNTEDPAPWAAKATDILKAFDDQLRQIAQSSETFGSEFNASEATLRAYQGAVEALIEVGVPLDLALDKAGRNVKGLGGEYQNLAADARRLALEQEALNAQYDIARQAVAATLTPLEELRIVQDALFQALADGKITWDEFNRAMGQASAEFDEVTKSGLDLQQVLSDIVTDGIDELVDGLFRSGRNLREFLSDILVDLTKVLLKLSVLEFLKETKLFGTFATGGFLPAGEVGLVGERGPELVMAGHSGLSITPMPASAASVTAPGAQSDAALTVNVNVTALDRRDVVSFFEDNESLVAGAMVRAQRKSAMLRRALGGG